MHSRQQAICIPSLSDRSYQLGGLNQLCPLLVAGRCSPHPSQIAIIPISFSFHSPVSKESVGPCGYHGSPARFRSLLSLDPFVTWKPIFSWGIGYLSRICGSGFTQGQSFRQHHKLCRPRTVITAKFRSSGMPPDRRRFRSFKRISTIFQQSSLH